MKPNQSKQSTFRNHLKRNYKHYYAQNNEGVLEEVERLVCLSYDPATSFNGRYPQRWYCDFESDYIVRLNRDKTGEQLYKAAMSLRRKENDMLAEQFGCVGNDCQKCKGWEEIADGESKCECCSKKVVFVTLDSENEYEGTLNGIDLDSGIDVSRQYETSYLLETLHEVLKGFTSDERKLWKCLAADMKKKEIALLFVWTLKQLEYRESKLCAKLRSNKVLKSFFEK